jgi:hypothetical protein
VEDGVGGHRGLMIAPFALVFPSGADQIGLIVATARASEFRLRRTTCDG